jgi:uncharacterized protein (TIGR02145 family)
MKIVFTLLLTILFTVIISAQPQVPNKISFQCVVRDAAGELVKDHPIGISISILANSATGQLIFQETYPNPQTNENGLVTVEIGAGTPVHGTFSNINWQGGTFFIRTEIDPTGGTNYTISGTSQLLSVPYALYAGKSANDDELFRELALLRAKSGFSTIIDSRYNTTTNVVKIGSQYWMADDLNVVTYFNGDSIGTKYGDISQEVNPKYVWPGCGSNYYTYWVLTDPRGVCPNGFRIANNQDWTNLFAYLGNDNDLLGKLLAFNGGGGPFPIPISNESGLSLSISGSHNSSGFNSDCSPFGWYWCVDAVDINLAHVLSFTYQSTNISGPGQGTATPGNGGKVVRCIKN